MYTDLAVDRWETQIAGQSSGTSGVGKFSFELPTVISANSGSHMGYTMTVVGTNFGPRGGNNVQVFLEDTALWNQYVCPQSMYLSMALSC